MSFGEKLKQLRTENKLTQEQLSKVLNVSRSTVGRYETDERFPDKDTLVNIADYFNVSVDLLLERNLKGKEIKDMKNIIKGNSDSYLTCEKYDDKIITKLIKEKIINDGDVVPKEILEFTIKYGINAAIEIYKAKMKTS